MPKKRLQGEIKQERNEEVTKSIKNQNYAAAKTTEIRLARRSPTYWRVTFAHPPLNIFGPETIPQLNEIIRALEADEHVKVVVFDKNGFTRRRW